jgi:hypothetical protein
VAPTPRIVEIRGEQDPAAQRGPRLAQAAHDAMVEAVHRVALGHGPGAEHREQRPVVRRRQSLQLHPHIAVAHELEYFLEQGERLAVADPHLADLLQREQRDRPVARHLGVVVDHDRPVAGGVNVELDAVRIHHHRASERRAGILVLVS